MHTCNTSHNLHIYLYICVCMCIYIHVISMRRTIRVLCNYTMFRPCGLRWVCELSIKFGSFLIGHMCVFSSSPILDDELNNQVIQYVFDLAMEIPRRWWGFDLDYQRVDHHWIYIYIYDEHFTRLG